MRWPVGTPPATSFGFSAMGAQTLTVGDILTRVRERWVLAVAPVVVGVAAAAAYTVTAPSVYVSTASVVVQPVLAEQFGNVNLSSVINMSTESQLARSSAVAVAAGQQLGLSGEAVRAAFSVDTPQDTQVLNIHFRSATADGAAAGAQTVAEAYLAYREGSAQADADRRLTSVATQIEAVNARLAEGGGQTGAYQEALRALLADQRELTSIKATSGGRVITKAMAPLQRSSPRPIVDLAIGLAAGLIGGLVLSVLWPRRRRAALAVEGPRRDGPAADLGWSPATAASISGDERSEAFLTVRRDDAPLADDPDDPDDADHAEHAQHAEHAEHAEDAEQAELTQQTEYVERADQPSVVEPSMTSVRSWGPSSNPISIPTPQPPPIPAPGRPGVRPGTPTGTNGARSTSTAIGGVAGPGSMRSGSAANPPTGRRSARPPRNGGSQNTRSTAWFNR